MSILYDLLLQVPSFLSSESESTFQEEDELMRQSQNWEEELSTRCEQWRVFKDQLREFTSCSEDLYNQLIIGIDSRPIGMFLEDLGAFGEQLKVNFDMEAWGVPNMYIRMYLHIHTHVDMHVCSTISKGYVCHWCTSISRLLDTLRRRVHTSE